jgi:hypothetical protein
MSGEVRAVVIAALLVAVAAAAGIAAGQRARPVPTPRPVPSPTVTALPAATPADPAEVERRAFAQPLVGGCATDGVVWLVADGGSAIRWDGRAWTVPDPTLRSLAAAQCDRSTMLAVGAGGSLLTVDEELRQVRADRFGTDDLTALARTGGGAVAVGAAGTVVEQSDLGWRAVPAGATEDLHGVAVTRSGSAVTGWIVGAGGAVYRFAQGRWEKTDTGTTATLRAVVQLGDAAVAVGDAGVAMLWRGAGWETISRGTGALRAAAVVGASTVWAVGDSGTVIEWSRVTGPDRATRTVQLGTACTLRAVFAEGSTVWIVGSDGTRGGAWRISPGGTQRWGTC